MSAPRLPAFQIEPHPSQQRSRGLSKHRNADRGPVFQELLLALCKFGMLDGPWWPSLAWPPAPLSHSLAFLSSADGQGLGSFPRVVPGLGTSRPGLSSQTSDAAPPPFPQGSFPDLLALLLSRAPFLLHSLCHFPSGPLSLCTHGTATCCHLPSPVNTPPWTVSTLTLSPLYFQLPAVTRAGLDKDVQFVSPKEFPALSMKTWCSGPGSCRRRGPGCGQSWRRGGAGTQLRPPRAPDSSLVRLSWRNLSHSAGKPESPSPEFTS